MAPGTLTGTALITFDDIAGGAAPGTNYDATFESGTAAFGERFAGQMLTLSGDHDVLSGMPSGPLMVAAGAPSENLNVFFYTTSNVLNGLGPKGYPNFDAIGEGAFAVLFDFDQSEFGFDLVGGNAGNAYVNFFRRDGSLIDMITLGGLSDTSYGFKRDMGIKDIAGISIHNDDLGGIGFDNLRSDVPGVVGPPGVVPEPTSMTLLATGALGLIGRLRRRNPSA